MKKVLLGKRRRLYNRISKLHKNENLGYREIAERLNAEGVTSTRGGKWSGPTVGSFIYSYKNTMKKINPKIKKLSADAKVPADQLPAANGNQDATSVYIAHIRVIDYILKSEIPNSNKLNAIAAIFG